MRILRILLTSVLLVYGNSAEDSGKKGEGVHYKKEDGILMLDAETFRDTVHNSSISWFVEFYSRWCGNCKVFAPTYRELAKDIKDWESVVRLAAVDCVSKSATGLDTGRKLCFTKPFFISGMPDFRFFPPFSTDEQFSGIQRRYEGTKVYGADGKVVEDSDSVVKIKNKIISLVQEHAKESLPKPHFSLETLKKKQLMKMIEEGTVDNHRVIIIEPKNSFVGRQIILDMLPYNGLHVFRLAETNQKALSLLEETYKYKPKTSPSVIMIESQTSFSEIQIPENIEDHQEYIKSKLISLPNVERLDEQVDDDDVEEQDDLDEDVAESSLLDIVRSKVYMQDLEVALHYTLRKEISGIEYIRGRNLMALKDYVALLVQYFPGRGPVMRFLKKLERQVKNLVVDQMIVWGTWQDMIEKAEKTTGAYLTDNETYVGCSGSLPEFRGFPCSLWQLFHVLVNEAYSFDPEGDWAVGVLIAMKEYITRYFTCLDCRRHWTKATDDVEEVSNSTEAILYLWRKHNSVNLRLSGGKNDDPVFPKKQWPTEELCPQCWTDNKEFNEDEVFKFLITFYSPSNIAYVEEDEELKRPADEL